MEEINYDALNKEYGEPNLQKQKSYKLKKEQLDRKERIIVTTCDLKQDYEIIGPVYMQINNRGDQIKELKAGYATLIEKLRRSGQGSQDSLSGMEAMWAYFVDSGPHNGHADFDSAFFICVEELKERAALMNADAIIGMRQDIDLDSSGFQYFYLQMYGTAVRFK